MKKILFAILTICVFLMNVHVLAVENYAEIVFGGNDVNIDSWTCPYGTIVDKDGKKAILVNKTKGEYIKIKVSDSFIYTPEADQAVIISIEYYDEGNGCFTITYDGLHNKQYYDTSQTNAETVQLENSGTWKTHEFYLDDIKFANTYWQGLDFRIGLWANEMGLSKDNVAFGSVKIEKTYAREPIKSELKTDFYGNIFGADDEKKMSLEIRNIADVEVKAKYKYNISDEYGKIIYENDFEEIFEKKEKKSKFVDMSAIDKFGLYTLNISVEFEQFVEDSKKTGITKDYFEFSLINKPREKNKKQYASVHLWQGMDNTVQIAKYAGMGGVREEIEWNDVEKTKGVLNVPEKNDTFVNKIIDDGMDYLILCAFGNQYYDNEQVYDNKYAPYTDEGIAAYAEYCAYLAEKYKGKVEAFEIWNEYNITDFNKRDLDGAAYAKMLKAAYTAIKKVNPEAVVVGMCTAGTDVDFMREVLEAGGYDYMDVVSCHPYDWSGSFRLSYYMERVRGIQNLFKEYGGEKPIWFTEIGISSADSDDSTTEEMQAAYAVQMYVVGVAENLADRLYWYNLQDCGTTSTNREHKFGLVNSQAANKPHTAKPAMVAVAGMNSFLNDATAKGKMISENSIAYKFEKANGDEVYIVWSENDLEEVSFNFGSEKISIYDIYTNQIEELRSLNGIYKLTTGKTPMYIKVKRSGFANISLDNIVKENDIVSLGISLDNISEETISGIFKWNITDLSGESVASGTKARTMETNQKFIFGINTGNIKNGSYKVKFEFLSDISNDIAEYSFKISS